MQSGRIAPVFRQFFSDALGIKNATDSHSQNRQPPQKEPQREPTQEEALEALDCLTQQDDFQKNALRAELRNADGHYSIYVFNALGAQLRAIKGVEIFRLLAGSSAKSSHRGQILDRRV